MKRSFSAKIDPHTERVFDVHLQSNNAKQRCSTRQINQQVEVASFFVEPLGNRTEDTHAARSLRCCEGQNVVALDCECLRGTHRTIFAGSEVPAAIHGQADAVTTAA
jgi:hypothetical protein